MVLILGANRGDVTANFRRAQAMINSAVGPVMRCSHRYESPAWGFTPPDGEQEFSNQALVVDTDLSPREVLQAVQSIETALGRDRAAEEAAKKASGQGYASRPMDIDILYYDDVVVNESDLQIPHPRIGEREFVLAPLRELGLVQEG